MALAQNRLAAGIYLTSFGLPFLQAGEELSLIHIYFASCKIHAGCLHYRCVNMRKSRKKE